MKLTKKYYRDQINSSYHSAKKVFLEALLKYGPHCTTRGWRDCPIDAVPNNRNGSIIGFSYVKKIFYVDIYWQGDLTDGEDSVPMDWTGVTLKAVSWFDGERTREDHSDVSFEPATIYTAMKKFADKYLN